MKKKTTTEKSFLFAQYFLSGLVVVYLLIFLPYQWSEQLAKQQAANPMPFSYFRFVGTFWEETLLACTLFLSAIGWFKYPKAAWYLAVFSWCQLLFYFMLKCYYRFSVDITFIGSEVWFYYIAGAGILLSSLYLVFWYGIGKKEGITVPKRFLQVFFVMLFLHLLHYLKATLHLF